MCLSVNFYCAHLGDHAIDSDELNSLYRLQFLRAFLSVVIATLSENVALAPHTNDYFVEISI